VRFILRSRPVQVGLLVVALLFMLVLRVGYGSYSALERARVLRAEGDAALAALAYREAITWYLPGSPWVARAIEGMWELADEAEAAGDWVAARTIVSNLRGALYGVRSFYQPHAEIVAAADERLAALLAQTDERVLAGTLDLMTAFEEFRADVARDHAPSVPWSLALGLGFLGWVAASFLFLTRLTSGALGAPLQWRRAWPWGAASLACATIWLAGAAWA
jgi:hypothetical protein